jgi:hypothetical protein
MIIDIPVKLHVKQYLLKNIFIEKPFRLNDSDPLGIMLKTLLEPKRKAGLPLRYSPDRVIHVNLGKRNANIYKQWLPPHKARMFNNFIDGMIKQEFYVFANAILSKSEHEKIDRLIREFEEKYDLSETELSFGTLKRMYYRSRARSKETMTSSI